MTRLQAVDPATATGTQKEVLDQVAKKFGRIPNIFALMANSPAAVKAYLSFNDALAAGSLDAKVRELIAIACAETHSCEYCLSAHMAIGKSAGLTDNELKKAQQIQSDDPKADAALTFVRNLLLRRADLPDSDIDALRTAGFTDGEIAEIIATVSINIYTNYFNITAQTELDFPKVALAFPP